jgi:hypothetical protein
MDVMRRISVALWLTFLSLGCESRTVPARPAPSRAPSRPDLRWIEGLVLERGKPAVGLELTWQPFFPDGQPPADGAALPTSVPLTDAQGRFALEAPRVATVFLGTGREKSSAVRLLRPADAWSGVALELQPEGTLEIQVRGPGGAPVPGAEVRVAQAVMEYQAAMRALFAASANALAGEVQGEPAAPLLGEPAEARAPGTFLSRPLHAGLWHVLVRAPGFKKAQAIAQPLPGGVQRLAVTLEPAAIVDGRLDAAGEPGAARVTLAPATARPPPPLPAAFEEQLYEAALRAAVALRGIEDPDARELASKDGRFTFDDLEPGPYLLSVSRPGFFPEERKVFAPARGLRIALEPTAELTVEVRDAEGFALPAKVALDPSATCRSSGVARLDGTEPAPQGPIGPVPRCPYVVRARSEGCDPAQVSRVLEAENAIVLTLRCRPGHPRAAPAGYPLRTRDPE